MPTFIAQVLLGKVAYDVSCWPQAFAAGKLP